MSYWYIIYNGQRIGPMTRENIMAYNPTPDTQVWREGMAGWQPIYTIPELMELINGMRPSPSYPQGVVNQPPMPPANSYAGASSKDKMVAGILALLIGGLGIQYFYIGKTTAGLLTILLSFVTCGIWPIIMFIQGIIMLTMSQQEFDRKFVNTPKSFPIF